MQALESDLQTQVLDASAAARARYVRTRILWKYVEPDNTVPPTYLWSGADQAAALLAQHGLVSVVSIYGHPDWAASTECGPIDRVPLSRFGDFVRALVERYDADGQADAAGSPRIGFWEISNEPDFDSAHAGGETPPGGCFGGRADAYAEYLRVAYLAAKSADPTAEVLFGGVAYDRFHNKSGYSPTGPFDYDFVGDTLDHLYGQHGSEAAWPFFDTMAVHVYNDYRDNWDGTPPYEQELVGKIGQFREAQLVHAGWFDLRSRALAVTEAGLASMPANDGWTLRSESLQSAYPGQLLSRVMAVGATQAIWFSIEDHRMGNCGNPYDWLGLGLLRSLAVYQAAQSCNPNPVPEYQVASPHERKPSHTAFGAAVGQLAGSSYDRQLTVTETGSSLVQAYRFVRPGGARLVVAFTDNGDRLGKIGSTPAAVSMTFDASILPGWTGTLAVTDHLGNTRVETGSWVTLDLTQWPVYVTPD